MSVACRGLLMPGANCLIVCSPPKLSSTKEYDPQNLKKWCINNSHFRLARARFVISQKFWAFWKLKKCSQRLVISRLAYRFSYPTENSTIRIQKYITCTIIRLYKIITGQVVSLVDYTQIQYAGTASTCLLRLNLMTLYLLLQPVI